MLDRDAWLERRRRLESLGGSPSPDRAPRGDPILFGPEPAARGDGWKERGQWDRAEAAYVEAVRARPFNREVRDALARLHIERGHLDQAAATLLEAIRLRPEDGLLLPRLGVVRLLADDRAGWRRSVAEMVGGFGGTTDAATANSVAWACAIAPGGPVDPEVPVRLAEAAIRNSSVVDRANQLNTLGAALYRAGRYDEAIGRMEEGIRLRGGRILPTDAPLLAMAHHSLGHHGEARHWLDRLREHQPDTDPAQFWDELEIRLLRSEAEAMILNDPAFPDDPFAVNRAGLAWLIRAGWRAERLPFPAPGRH